MTSKLEISPKLEKVLEQLSSVLIFDRDKKTSSQSEKKGKVSQHSKSD